MKIQYKLLPILLLFALTSCLEYSSGDRAGQVIKFSKKGFFCKTWEGEMNLGGMRQETTFATSSDGKSTTPITSMVANTFNFTVEDPKLIPQVQEALESGHRVVLVYRQEMLTFCRSNSDYFVTEVKW